MRLENLVNVLARRRRGAWVLGGLAAALDTVERLMTVPGKRRSLVLRTAPAFSGPTKGIRKRTDFFSIKRTQSDLGLTYWVLQGHGVYASFELFDTWPEAMAAAEARLAETSIVLVR